MGQRKEPPCDHVDRLEKEAGARVPIRCRRGNPRDAGTRDRGTRKRRMVARRPPESRRNAPGSPRCYGGQVPRFGLANGRYLGASPLATVLSPTGLTARGRSAAVIRELPRGARTQRMSLAGLALV